MPEQRHVFRLGRSLVAALPPKVLEHLGVSRGDAIYWHLARGAEAVITKRDRRVGGHPEGMALERKLIAVEAEVARLRQRNEARDRTMYAEGWNAGAITTQERLSAPHGSSAERARRRKMHRYIFADADRAKATRVRRSAARTETVPGPDQFAGSSAPPPGAQPHEEGGSPPARPIPGPPLSLGVPEEGGVGAGRPLPGQP